LGLKIPIQMSKKGSNLGGNFTLGGMKKREKPTKKEKTKEIRGETTKTRRSVELDPAEGDTCTEEGLFDGRTRGEKPKKKKEKENHKPQIVQGVRLDVHSCVQKKLQKI